VVDVLLCGIQESCNLYFVQYWLITVNCEISFRPEHSMI
jgi:hypothetical protein